MMVVLGLHKEFRRSVDTLNLRLAVEKVLMKRSKIRRKSFKCIDNKQKVDLYRAKRKLNYYRDAA